MAAPEEEIARAKTNAQRKERRARLEAVQRAQAELAAKEEFLAQISAAETEKKEPPP
jgi:hypothetical protein